MTQGYGTYENDDYIASASSPDGGLLVAHTTPAITVDLSRLSGPVDAAWFDPTTGTTQLIDAALPNSGTRRFTPPGSNAAGDSDWVLVLARD